MNDSKQEMQRAVEFSHVLQEEAQFKHCVVVVAVRVVPTGHVGVIVHFLSAVSVFPAAQDVHVVARVVHSTQPTQGVQIDVLVWSTVCPVGQVATQESLCIIFSVSHEVHLISVPRHV